MAIRSGAELSTALKGILGDAPSDAGLALMEDLSDTLSDLTSNGSAADWKKKYEDNDRSWRKRYADRFNAPVDEPDDNKDSNKNNDKPRTFESLFKEE